MSLVLYPAIDLLGGKVVRLHRGDRTRVTVYAEDPVGAAARLCDEGAEWLHVVDLDAAFDGAAARQYDIVSRIVRRAGAVPVQVGGGLRDLAAIEQTLDAGVSRVLLGTAAVENPETLREALARFGAERVAVAVDEKDGRVRVRGWVDSGGGDAAQFAAALADRGVRWFLHSAIARDGTLEGPDLAALRRVGDEVARRGGRVLCAGGVGTLEHLRALRAAAVPGLVGAVTGRALYEGAFTLAQARRALAEGA